MMTVKDIKNIIGSATNVHLFVAKNKEDAINEHSQYMYTFHKYTSLSNYYSRLKVVCIYPADKDDLEGWAIEE